jgi:hypothetical protein
MNMKTQYVRLTRRCEARLYKIIHPSYLELSGRIAVSRVNNTCGINLALTVGPVTIGVNIDWLRKKPVLLRF